MTENTPQAQPRKPRHRWLRRLGLCCGGLTLAIGLAAVVLVTVVATVGIRSSAPDWLRDRIATRINSDLPGLSVEFGDLSVVLEDDWVPRLSLRQVEIRDATGAPVARLSDMQGTVALGPLLHGQLQPGAIWLSGASILLRRTADGEVRLSLGETTGTVQEAETVSALIERADAFFQRPQFAALREVTADNLTVRYEDARVDRAWTVDGGRISVKRDGEDLIMRTDFALLGARDYATTLAMTYASRIGETAAEFTLDFEDMPAGDIAGQSPALAWLMALDAPISGSIRAAVDNAGRLGPLDARLEIGTGVLHPNEGARPVAFDHASSHFTYDPDQQILRFRTLEVDSKWVRTRIEGETRLEGMEDGWPDALISQFRVRALSANPMDLYPEPVTFEGATLDMRLMLDPFRVTVGEMSLSDQGRQLVIRGDVQARPDGWYVSVDGKMPGIDPDRLLALWPRSVKPKTRLWITENVRAVELRDIQFALRSEPRHRPNVFLGFDFDKLTSRFIKNVPVIEDGAGHASIFDNRFVIAAKRGHVTAAQGGRIDISGSSFDIPDIRIKRGPGRVRLKTESTITAALSLLNEEPFRFLDKAGRPVTLADGRARVEGTLDFLVVDDLQPDDVAFDMTGRLSDVRSETLIEGRVLAASELDLRATHERLRIEGEGRIGRVPFSGWWEMPFEKGSKGRSHVEGWIELSERFIDEFGIALPPGSVSGAGRGEIEIDFGPDAPPAFRMTSDLAGLALRLQPLGWQLGAEQTGSLRVEGTLGTPPGIDRLSINAGGLSAEGSVTLTEDGQLQQASFTRVQLGTWIDAPVDLVGLGAGKPPLVRVLGGMIDLRQTSLASKKDGAGTPPRGERGPVSLRLDRLQVSDTIALTDFNAELDMSRGPDGEFTGKVNGQSQISGRVLPSAEGSAFRIVSQNAGGVLRSAKVLENARDGTLEMVLVPQAQSGTYRGKLTIKNVRVKDAPAMAALLNALSVIGLLEQLGGEGIHFGQVDADFELAPDRVTVYSGSAVGASMGISMEGYYYLETGYLDMEGVISPVYAVNMLGGMFSRQGEGLIGFKYDLKGPKESPRVDVNPLSVLTPSIFREIFRRPPPSPSGPSPAGEKAERQDGQTREQDR